MKNEFLQTEEAIVAMLKTVYDPEIPVNVYDLGLIYKIDVDDEKNVQIDMTLTAPNCPAADFLLEDIRMKVASIEGVKNVEVNLVFEPEWDKDMMSQTLTWGHASTRTQELLKSGLSAGWTASKRMRWRSGF